MDYVMGMVLVRARVVRVVMLGWVLVACGTAPPAAPRPPANAGAPAADLDAACAPAGEIKLDDGSFHCRQLPFAAKFPPGTVLTRQDQGTAWNSGSFYVTQPTKDLRFTIIAGPQKTPMTDEEMDRMIDMSIHAIAPDAVQTPIEPPALTGATISRGVAITTSEGNSGILHAYYGYNWLVAVMVAARKGHRADQPMGREFLDSLQLRPLPAGRVELALIDGATVEIPANSWDANVEIEDPGSRFVRWYVVPGRATLLGVRVFDAQDFCGRMRFATVEELGPLLDTTMMIGPITSTTHRHTERGAYFEVDDPDKGLISSSIVCLEPLAVQLLAVSEDTTAPRALVEELAPTVKSAR